MENPWTKKMNKQKITSASHADRTNSPGGSVKRSLAMVFPESRRAGKKSVQTAREAIPQLKTQNSKLKTTICAFMFAMLIPLSNCTLYRPITHETGHYYINPSADFSTVGKTVIFELDNLSTRPELSIELTQVLTDAIRKRHLFNISTLYRREPAWRTLDLSTDSSYSLEELSTIRKQLKADAVLFGRINQYYPYPNLLVGIHLKLIDLRNGKLLWATEQVWDSSDKRVERRMRLYFNSQMRAGFQPLDWELLVTSPRAFNKFVACEIAQTLPLARQYASRSSENFRRPATISGKFLEIPQKTLKFTSDLTKMGAQVTGLNEQGN